MIEPMKRRTKIVDPNIIKLDATRGLAVALFAAGLCACGSGGDGGGATTTPASASPAASEASTTAAGATTAASATSSTTATTTAAPTTAAAITSPTPSSAPPVVTNIDPGDGGAYAPVIDPTHFSSVIDNPYLPFLPGMKWVYEGINENGEHETTTVEVLTATRAVMGVPATVVHDLVEIDGQVAEDTSDWYAQDDQGNVWYLGEDTTAYDGGTTSKEGSWEAGVDGALPGIVMPATPKVGTNGYRQEYRPGDAEDMALVVATGGDQTVGTVYHEVVVTQEWTPLEPDITEQKSYAPGVGVITEDIVRGGTEHHELVSFSGNP